MVYYIWGVLTSFMVSLNALSWSENVLKCVKSAENPLPSYFAILIDNTLLLMQWRISIIQTKTGYPE